MGRLTYQDLYSGQLFSHGHGCALLDPEPHQIGTQSQANLREAYEQGIRIGDVGLVGKSGDFKSIFNVFRPGDDPINMIFGVPPGFQHLPFHENHLSSRNLYYPSNTWVCSKKARSTVLDADGEAVSALFGPGLGIQFQFSQSQGAALFLPGGARRIDYTAPNSIRAYIEKNALSWYQFVHELDLGAYNGSLYLVTGYDRTSCYQNLAFSGSSFQSSLSFTFSSALLPTGNVGVSLSYSSLPSDQRWLGASVPAHTLDNLSPFIRGFKIMIKPHLIPNLKLLIKISDLATSESLSKRRQALPNPPLSSSTASSSSSSSLYRPMDISTDLSISSDRHDPQSGSPASSQILSYPSSTGDTELAFDSTSSTESSFSDSDLESDSGASIVQLHHPSDIINAFILDKCADAHVAITHDNEWSSVLEETDNQFPDATTLINRMSKKFPSRFQHIHDIEADWSPAFLHTKTSLPDWESQEHAPKTSESVLACFFCRERKIPCDGPYPTCNQCKRRSLQCEYPVYTRKGMRRTASKSKGVVKAQGTKQVKSGCYTCKIRRKKCDNRLDELGRCQTCVRLRIQCLDAKCHVRLQDKENVSSLREKIKNFLASQGMIKGHAGGGSLVEQEQRLYLVDEAYNMPTGSSQSDYLILDEESASDHSTAMQLETARLEEEQPDIASDPSFGASTSTSHCS